jgi:hypothetical protein
MLADFELIFLGREAIELIPVRQFARKGREAIFTAVTAISLEPGKDFAKGLYGQVGQL